MAKSQKNESSQNSNQFITMKKIIENMSKENKEYFFDRLKNLPQEELRALLEENTQNDLENFRKREIEYFTKNKSSDSDQAMTAG